MVDMIKRTCATVLSSDELGKPVVVCGMPADRYMTLTVDTLTGWSVARWKCAGCAEPDLPASQK